MTSSDKVNILMVDDQPSKLLSYEVILKDLGENLVKATSGKEALEYLLKNDIAVILMDVSMPDIDGFELADVIREHPRYQKTAIIFISAVHLTDLDRIKGYQRGAVDYISVPVVPELLRAKVSVFAELHRKNRQLEKLNQELEQRVAERSEELRNLNELLQQRLTELETIMQVLPVGIAVAHDRECRAITANAALSEFQVLDEAENISKNGENSPKLRLEICENGKVLSTQDLPLHRAASTGKPTESVELEIRRADGTSTYLFGRANPLFDDTGAVRGAVGAFYDITSRKLMEETLRKSEKLAAMGRVAGIVAHEINNPLDAISNAFYLLRDHHSLDQEALHLAKIAEQELERVCHITKQTLSFYRESQQMIPVCISEILDDVLELQSRSLQLSGIKLDKQYRSKGSIQGFPVELKQVFLNLIGNAIQAMPTGGRLRVRVFESSQNGKAPGTCVSICDTGIGVPPEQAKRLFEPFFTTKSTKGTGLGLWISKGIIQKYEGALRFRSIALSTGKATCFSVFIPGSNATRKLPDAIASHRERPLGKEIARRGIGSV
jgi:signal transduction histidine kinase